MPAAPFRIFNGVSARAADATPLPAASVDKRRDAPELYITPPGLRDAVNIAVHLSCPLLITGEAGTGKTQLAYRVAYELTPTFPTPLRFQTKARAEASDLFYRYDALRHFQEVQVKQNHSVNTRDFLRLEALGIAILRSMADREAANAMLDEQYRTDAPVRSVVLIDEIDKAPRDLPNDLLAEIENMSFEIKETGDRFSADPQFKPVVILTSNSERDLPDAFLRRCVYYHIPPPDRDALRKIVQNRVALDAAFSPAMLENALIRFEEIRKAVSKKQPSTAELTAWISVLNALKIDPKNPQGDQREMLAYSYSVLVKDAEDLKNVSKIP